MGYKSVLPGRVIIGLGHSTVLQAPWTNLVLQPSQGSSDGQDLGQGGGTTQSTCEALLQS